MLRRLVGSHAQVLATEATQGAVASLQRWAVGDPEAALEAAAGLVRWCGTHANGHATVRAAFGHGEVRDCLA
jgi:hypothetical protein